MTMARGAGKKVVRSRRQLIISLGESTTGLERQRDYVRAAEKRGMSLSEWGRVTLDREAGIPVKVVSVEDFMTLEARVRALEARKE